MVKQKKGEGDKRWMVDLSAHTKRTLSFSCNNTTQDNTKPRKTPIDEGKSVSARRRVRCVLIISKAPRHTGP